MDLRIFTEPQQGATYDTLLATARAAERLGFDAFFRSDHYLKMGGVTGLPGPTDAWITLAGLARDTSTIRLGTLVNSATFRHPGPLAITVAQVDAMSGGRVELGLGAGWYEAEHKAYGIPFPPLGERFDVLEDQLAILRGLWSRETSPENPFTYEGRRQSVVASPGLPKPVQVPGPPIVMGGRGKSRTPRLAATYASEFNIPFSSMDDVRTCFGYLRDACDKIGRDVSSIVHSVAQVVVCGRDDAEIARRAAAIGREVEELRRNGLCGTPAEIVEKLAAWRATGATRVYLQLMDLSEPEHLELLGTAVLPEVRSL